MNFQDPDLPTGTAGEAEGIEFPQTTLGVNWYLADHVRILCNYSYCMPGEPNTGTSAANIFATRLSVFW
jgi:phosphate-selective porin OprO/OprP